MNVGEYLMRNAHMADITEILAFYKANRNINNAIRDDEQLIQTTEDKKLFLVTNKDTQKIEAVSGTFDHMDGDYREIGATFVNPHLRGFGIGPTFISVRFLNEELLDPNFMRFFAVVKPDNKASMRNLQSAGFSATRPDDTVQRFKDLSNRQYYELQRSWRHEHARRLLATDSEPCRKRKNGDTMVVQLDVEILRPDWRTMVCALSAHI